MQFYFFLSRLYNKAHTEKLNLRTLPISQIPSQNNPPDVYRRLSSPHLSRDAIVLDLNDTFSLNKPIPSNTFKI